MAAVEGAAEILARAVLEFSKRSWSARRDEALGTRRGGGNCAHFSHATGSLRGRCGCASQGVWALAEQITAMWDSVAALPREPMPMSSRASVLARLCDADHAISGGVWAAPSAGHGLP